MHDPPRDPVPLRLVKPGPDDDGTTPEGTVLEGELVDGPVPDEDEGEGGYYPNPIVEHAQYAAAGVVVVARRSWRSMVLADYTDQIKAATVLGDQDRALLWEEKREKRRNDRHALILDWITLPAQAAAHALPISLAAGGSALGIGILLAIAEKDPKQVIAPFVWAAEVVHWAKVAVEWGWAPALLTAIGTAGWAVWRTGIDATDAGEVGWLHHLRAIDGHEGEPITPSIVVTALRELGLSSLRKSIESMGDAGAAMLGPITMAGCGVELEATLPIGTSTEEVMNRHRKLAEGVGRHQHEVFLTVAQRPRTIKYFIANSGALDEPIGPSPLVTDANIKADYYSGRAPIGQTLRGDPGTVNVFQQHVLITGKSNQGKTAVLRSLALWLAFDTSVEFRIADLKGVGDWAMFDGRATTLIQGPTDQDCMAATHMVEGMVEEMNRRLTALKRSGSEDGVTREMARTPGSGFHPLVGIVDEAQKAYMCPAIGPDKRPYGGRKQDARYLRAIREIKNQGRAVNVTIWEGTQDPTDENLPKISREASHLRLALYLATKSQAGMALGEAPVEQGAAPHKLRDGLDRGTFVGHGPGIDVPRGEPALTVRTHYVNGKEAHEVADRAKARCAKVQTRSGEAEPEVTRNLLEDLEAVLRDRSDKIRLANIPALLEALVPGYQPYVDLTGRALEDVLDELGVRWTKPGNVPQVDPKDFRVGFERAAKGLPDRV